MNLTITGLHKTFADKNGRGPLRILEDLDLRVVSGEFVSIVGPSGCGKTTLIEIVAGLQSKSGGRILIDDVPLEESRANRAIVFQQYGLFPWLTVRKNIEYGLKIRKVPRSERHAVSSNFIEMVNLTGYENHYPHELSGGMQQRVALARALANSPDILLLDEPFAALDAQTKETCQQELLDLWRKTRLTVVFITHDISEALFLSDRVMVMSSNPGAIRKTIDVGFRRPRDRSVRMDEDFRQKEFQIRRLLDNGQPSNALCQQMN
jgi:NitT/TauT family transport system ATP-binding protein